MVTIMTIITISYATTSVQFCLLLILLLPVYDQPKHSLYDNQQLIASIAIHWSVRRVALPNPLQSPHTQHKPAASTYYISICYIDNERLNKYSDIAIAIDNAIISANGSGCQLFTSHIICYYSCYCIDSSNLWLRSKAFNNCASCCAASSFSCWDCADAVCRQSLSSLSILILFLWESLSSGKSFDRLYFYLFLTLAFWAINYWYQ